MFFNLLLLFVIQNYSCLTLYIYNTLKKKNLILTHQPKLLVFSYQEIYIYIYIGVVFDLEISQNLVIFGKSTNKNFNLVFILNKKPYSSFGRF